jgi:thymidine kinase
VIVGSMYSGKTEELIRRLRRAQIARQRVEIFKPTIDDRYRARRDRVAQRAAHSVARGPHRAGLLQYAHEAQVIGIDEGQFLGTDLVRVCETLARQGKRVIVAGLDQDYRAGRSSRCPQLLAIAEYITKTLAICVVCGEPANRTYRKIARPAAWWWAARISTKRAAGGAGNWAARSRAEPPERRNSCRSFPPHAPSSRALLVLALVAAAPGAVP